MRAITSSSPARCGLLLVALLLAACAPASPRATSSGEQTTGAGTAPTTPARTLVAAVWDLPILYVCENNQWQAYVARRETMLIEHVSDRAAGYGIEGQTVDGNDVEAVFAAASAAVAKVRATSKPFLLETYTYRTRGHYEPDDQFYVDKDELAAWKERDPILTLRNRLLQQELVTTSDLDNLEERVRDRIAVAAAFANASPYPAPEEVLTDVYA